MPKGRKIRNLVTCVCVSLSSFASCSKSEEKENTVIIFSSSFNVVVAKFFFAQKVCEMRKLAAEETGFCLAAALFSVFFLILGLTVKNVLFTS